MAWFGMGSSAPKCCCAAVGSTCKLLEDHFNRADDTNLGGDWDETAGDAEIVDEALVLPTGGTTVLGHAANPDGPYTRLSGILRLDNAGAKARMMLGYATSGHYLYATANETALVVGGIGMGGAGSASFPVTLALGTWYEWDLCFTGDKVIAHVNGVEGIKSGFSVPAGNKHGLAAVTGSVSFDDVIARRISSSCASCAPTFPPLACTGCVQNEIHPYWAVLVSGIAAPPTVGIDKCLECVTLNALWILDSGVIFDYSGLAGCDVSKSTVEQGFLMHCGAFGAFNTDLTLCIAAKKWVSPGVFDASTYVTRVAFWDVGFTGDCTGTFMWQYEHGATPVDCLALDGLTLPAVTSYLARLDQWCNEDASTCVINRYYP